MADLIVVMGEGKIRQAGTPIEIYRRPADAFVAAFIGSTNFFRRRPKAAARRCRAAASRASSLPAGAGDGLGPAGGHPARRRGQAPRSAGA